MSKLQQLLMLLKMNRHLILVTMWITLMCLIWLPIVFGLGFFAFIAHTVWQYVEHSTRRKWK